MNNTRINTRFTYLKNNGLYQRKLNRLILSNNVVIRAYLEIYNLFHGSNTDVRNSLLFKKFENDFYLVAPQFKGRLKDYTDNEFEYLFDYIIEYYSR